MRRWSCTSAWRGSGEPALAVLHLASSLLHLASSLLHRARASWRKVWACALHGVRRLPVWRPLWSFAAPPALALDSLAGGFAFAIALTCVLACCCLPARCMLHIVCHSGLVCGACVHVACLGCRGAATRRA
jgi:hypothetical protein